MKSFKRSAVIIAVLLFLCAAVYLNWSYNQKEAAALKKVDNAQTQETDVQEKGKTEETTGNDKKTKDAGLYYTAGDSSGTSSNGYFAEVRLNRQQARDEASSTFSAVAAANGASEETINEALGKMTKIAEWTVKEAELENLIMAKGFTDCVAFISDDGISVTVAASGGLSNAGVAQITDVVLSETDFTADQLKIVEIK